MKTKKTNNKELQYCSCDACKQNIITIFHTLIDQGLNIKNSNPDKVLPGMHMYVTLDFSKRCGGFLFRFPDGAKAGDEVIPEGQGI